MNKVFTIWFTGLNCSGKTSLSELLKEYLDNKRIKSEILNSGVIRKKYTTNLDFTRESIFHNVRRLCFEAKMLNNENIIAIVTAISPFKEDRIFVRNEIDEFIEAYCKADLKNLIKRDKQQLYEKAEKGIIQNVAGINYKYEEATPEIICYTDKETIEESFKKIINYLITNGFLKNVKDENIYSAEEENLIKESLKNLGYI